MSPESNSEHILSKFDLEYIDLTDPYYMTDRSNVQEDYLSKKGYPDRLVYNMCSETDPSENPYFCSLWSIRNDQFDCSTDYLSKTSCSTSYNTYTKCGQKALSNKNPICTKTNVIDESE